MSIFNSIKKLGDAAINTALTPVDLTVDLVTGFEHDALKTRSQKIKKDLAESYLETFTETGDK